MRQVSYFGMGPCETYIDKHHAGYHGVFRSTVSDLQEDYIRPQENGSHYDCDYVTVKGAGISLTAATGDPGQTFSFNASVYTQEELQSKKHNYELVPCGSTVLCLDHKLQELRPRSLREIQGLQRHLPLLLRAEAGSDLKAAALGEPIIQGLNLGGVPSGAQCRSRAMKAILTNHHIGGFCNAYKRKRIFEVV